MSPGRGIQPPTTVDMPAAGCMQYVSGRLPKQTDPFRRTVARLMLPACRVQLEQLNRAPLAKRDADIPRALHQPASHSCSWASCGANAQFQSRHNRPSELAAIS